MAATWRLTSPESRTYSQSSNEVWVVSGRFAGSSKPPRARLLEGLERIAGIRHEIARRAKVKSLPPVEVIPYVWRDAGGLILGQTTHLDVGSETRLGVRLPAQTALCQDADPVRAVLVHEFAHCFYFMKVIIDAVDGERIAPWRHPDLGALISSPDDAMLAHPADWFGEADAREFSSVDDGRTQAIVDLVPSLARQFLIRAPESSMSLGIVHINDEIRRHIRSLRSRT